MNETLTAITEFKDILGQTVRVGDVVLYPKLRYRSPMMTFAQILSIKEKTDFNGRQQMSIRIKAIDEGYGVDQNLYVGAYKSIATYDTTIHVNPNRLVKINPEQLPKIMADILLHNKIVPIYSTRVNGIYRAFVKLDDGTEVPVRDII